MAASEGTVDPAGPATASLSSCMRCAKAWRAHWPVLSIKMFSDFKDLTSYLLSTHGELDQLVDRPFSIREVRGSKPRFSMPDKKKGRPFPFARGWALARCWDHHQRPRASPAPPRGEEQCAVTTSFAAHTAGHHPAHSSPGRRRCAPPVEAQIALE